MSRKSHRIGDLFPTSRAAQPDKPIVQDDPPISFFDANAFIGRCVTGAELPLATASELLAEMDRHNVDRALVWHISQFDVAPTVGNRLLAEQIAPHERLTGCWTLLPPCLPEFPSPDELVEQMRAARVRALRVFPESHRYLLRTEVFGATFEMMIDLRVPLIVSLARGTTWPMIYDLLSELPELIVVVADYDCWGADRWFRPLLERYEHVYVDLADYLLDGGIEALVRDHGATRLLYGSGLPIQYPGGMMMAVKHAEIDPADKRAIASGNLERLLAEVRL